MIELNLEEIKKKLDFEFTTMYCLSSRYTWTEFTDLTKNLEYMNNPVFVLPKKNIRVGSEDTTPYAHAGCFGRFTYSSVSSHLRDRNERIDLIFSLKMNRVLKNEPGRFVNNYCWFSKSQIEEWLNICKEETGIEFNYKVTATKSEYTVTYDFKGIGMVKIKYVIFWTRYLYEFPTSLYVLDALLLKERHFPEESIINLLNTVVFSHDTNCFRMSNSQCITSYGKLLPVDVLKEKLNGAPSYLSSIFSLDTRYYRLINYGNLANCYWLEFRDLNGKVKLKLDPFIKYSDLIKKESATGNKHYEFNPVLHWISREERFERYFQVYDFLKSVEGK